jgi:hypothetical protein
MQFQQSRCQNTDICHKTRVCSILFLRTTMGYFTPCSLLEITVSIFHFACSEYNGISLDSALFHKTKITYYYLLALSKIGIGAKNVIGANNKSFFNNPTDNFLPIKMQTVKNNEARAEKTGVLPRKEHDEILTSFVSIIVKQDPRNKVNSACDFCKVSKAKCSDYRPCLRCVRANRASTCISNSELQRMPKVPIALPTKKKSSQTASGCNLACSTLCPA